jgi:hypothetical protein
MARVRPFGQKSVRGLHKKVRTVALAVGACVALLTSVSSANAEYVHPFLGSFNGSGTPDIVMFGLGVAVDNSGSTVSGDVYVSDALHKVVDRFSSDGTYECQITGAPGSPGQCDPSTSAVPGAEFATPFTGEMAVNGSGDVYVPDPGAHAIYEFASSGEYLEALAMPNEDEPKAVAITASGTLLVADSTAGTVLKYDSGTSTFSTFANEAAGSAFGHVAGVAVNNDATSAAYGDVYVIDATGKVDIYTGAGIYLGQITSTPAGALSGLEAGAVDPSSGEFYVAGGKGEISQFTAAGNYVATVSMPQGGNPSAIAISEITGDLYAADSSHQLVDIFGPGITIPTVAVSEPTAVEETKAVLHGSVDPENGGAVTMCEFEYGETESYGSTATCTPAPPYAAATDVSAELTNLKPGTRYYFRLDAKNASGDNRTNKSEFVTPGPAVVGAQWVQVGPTAATLNAEVDPTGYDTECMAEYVSSVQFEASGYSGATTVRCSPAAIGAQQESARVTASATGLEAGASYHYRFVATSKAGTVDGSDQSFTTFGFADAAVELMGEGKEFNQAGGHPDTLNTEITFNTTTDPGGIVNVTGTLKDVHVALPAGLVGNPAAIAQCPQHDAERFQCAPEAQVGVMIVESPEKESFKGPLFEVVPPKGVAAAFSARFNDFVKRVYRCSGADRRGLRHYGGQPQHHRAPGNRACRCKDVGRAWRGCA